MYPPNSNLAEQLAQLHRETAEIRRLCKKQRTDLAEQFNRLQAVRRALAYVEESLERSRDEMLENRFLLDLNTTRILQQSRLRRAG